MSVLITGNTYPVKDELKALGGKWDADQKGWKVPDDKADEARALVAGAPESRPRGGSKRRRRFGSGRPRCPACGRISDGSGQAYECGEPCGD